MPHLHFQRIRSMESISCNLASHFTLMQHFQGQQIERQTLLLQRYAQILASFCFSQQNFTFGRVSKKPISAVVLRNSKEKPQPYRSNQSNLYQSTRSESKQKVFELGWKHYQRNFITQRIDLSKAANKNPAAIQVLGGFSAKFRNIRHKNKKKINLKQSQPY